MVYATIQQNFFLEYGFLGRKTLPWKWCSNFWQMALETLDTNLRAGMILCSTASKQRLITGGTTNEPFCLCTAGGAGDSAGHLFALRRHSLHGPLGVEMTASGERHELWLSEHGPISTPRGSKEVVVPGKTRSVALLVTTAL